MTCKIEMHINKLTTTRKVSDCRFEAVVARHKDGESPDVIVLIGYDEVFFMDNSSFFAYSEFEYLESNYEILNIPAELNIKINMD
jgi:hypothetical protein